MQISSKRFARAAIGTSLSLPMVVACTRATPSTASSATPQSAPSIVSNRFPFPLPATGNAPGSLVDLSALNPAPITEAQRLTVKNGHYYTPVNKRVRFLAISMGARDLFPTHAEAEQVAARLHRFGINMVRLHHMDATWGTPNIFYFDGGNTHEKPMLKIDPQSLERFDYLVAQFKKNGIYVDLNLHVVRPWNTAMGFSEADKINQEGKVVSYFEPKAIQLQRQYARDIITHVNPYTKRSYAADPVVAAVEITNEDTLLGAADTIPNLPAHYQDILKTGWNTYLVRKYKNTEALRAAWAGEAKPLGREMIANGTFAKNTDGWTFEHQSGTEATPSVESAAGQTNAPEGKVLHISSIQTGAQDWYLQQHVAGLDFKEGERYTISFTAKASAPRSLGVNTRYDRAPWTMIGLEQKVSLTPQWKRYTLSFVARKPDPGHNRLSFVFGDSKTDFFLGDVSVRSGGGGSTVPAGQSVEAKNMEMVPVSASPSGTDFAAYLMETERRFADGMYRWIKTDLKSRGMIWCSQASYGGLGGTWREANMDSVDMHSYWEHPSFPGSAFDPNNYRTENKAMVNQDGLGTLDGLANHRVAGKPFTVSEYNHPAPNEYMAETVPIMFSYAAWQDWDGVFLFSYGGEAAGKINGFFDVTNDPALMAYLPTAASLFLRGDLAPSQQTITLSVPIPLVPKLKAEGSDYAFYATAGPMPDGASFWTHRAAIDFNNTKLGKPLVRLQGKAPATSPLVWDHSAGIYTIETPNTRAIIGFVGGKPTTVGGVTLAAEESPRNFAVLSVISRDNQIIEKSGSLLVTVMDKAENPGAEWNTERTFAAQAWDKGPVEIEGVTGTITIPSTAKSVRVYALDNSGTRGNGIPATITSGKITFAITPAQGTVWYEVVPTF